MVNVSKIIKSKERVRDLAEVFTGEKEVNSMLDLVKVHSKKIESTFFEPSCGNGNFLVAILKRKLGTIDNNLKKKVDAEFYIVKALSSIYGVDISEENINEARQRMVCEVKDFYANNFKTKKTNDEFLNSVNWILEKNIVVGDMLNKVDEVVLVEYSTPKKYHFKRQEFNLRAQSLLLPKVPLKNYKTCHYQNLCS